MWVLIVAPSGLTLKPLRAKGKASPPYYGLATTLKSHKLNNLVLSFY
jgi:hypothetical protein